MPVSYSNFTKSDVKFPVQTLTDILQMKSGNSWIDFKTVTSAPNSGTSSGALEKLIKLAANLSTWRIIKASTYSAIVAGQGAPKPKKFKPYSDDDVINTDPGRSSRSGPANGW